MTVREELCIEIDTWFSGGRKPFFDFEKLPDKIYKVDEKVFSLNEIVEFVVKELGSECNLNWLDVSEIKNMYNLFKNSEFNGDISRWDVSNVTTMGGMFSYSKFNGNISHWDVSKVTDMGMMFYSSCFDKNILYWDVSNVTNMTYMFARSNFNRNIYSWNVSNVTNMDGMFYDSKFDKDISRWDVSSVRHMNVMFASSFNKDISSWNVSNVESATNTFIKCPLETQKFKQPNFQSGVYVSFDYTNFKRNYRKKKKVNEDYLDKTDIDQESVSVLDDVRAELDEWIRDKDSKPLSFNPDVLPDHFYHVESKKHLSQIIRRMKRDYKMGGSLNWLDVTAITNMSFLFGRSDFNFDISRWDVSRVTDMDSMFMNCTFNGNISGWDVSRVENMAFMFCHSPFDKNISGWDVSSVTNYEGIFDDSSLRPEYRPHFNPKFAPMLTEDYLDKHDLQLDDVSVMSDVRKELDEWLSADGMIDAIKKRPSFNPEILPDSFYIINKKQDLHEIICKITTTLGNDCNLNWLDVSRVSNMRYVFAHMTFNGDISRWDVSNVEDMTSMFYDSTFEGNNGNISGWNVSSVRYMSKIFDKCPFCQDISSWNCASMKPELLKDALSSR